MPNTYTQLYIHFVFAVLERRSLIRNEWKHDLYRYMTGIVQMNNHKLIAINGMPNHIHVFIGYNPNQLIPDLLQNLKRDSCKWINENKFSKLPFNWQSGYGAFSYSQSQIDDVIKYIMNQEIHHKKTTFREEYIALLKRFNINYDERYILQDYDE
ncbi:MAG TPA: IS200/IS605 family transposase [Ignavibacteria bacterium]|nr:IS200/IS605 family transposase [Ignavibacteria bacterium]